MLGLVGGLDVNGIGSGLLDIHNLDSLAVTTGDAIALAFGCLDDEVDASVVGEFLVQLEGEGRAGAHDGGGGRRFHAGEGGGHQHDVAAQFHDPEVEPLEQVQAGNLAFGAQNGLGVLTQGELVPCEDLLVGQGLPLGGDHLHDALVLGLVNSTDSAAVTTVLDELAAFDFRCGNALGAAGHLFECDGGDVFHKRLRLRGLMDLSNRYSIAKANKMKVAVPVCIRTFCHQVSLRSASTVRVMIRSR